MIDRYSTSARARDAFRQARAEFTDRGELVAMAALLASGAHIVLAGGAPQWPAIAGGVISAAYLSISAIRDMVRKPSGPGLPKAVVDAASACAVRAIRDGDEGIWAVHEPARGKTRFMSDRQFIEFRSRMPEGSAVAVVEARGGALHVRRYVDGALSSTEEQPAHQLFDAEGAPLKSFDYENGVYMGEHAPTAAPSGP